LAFTLLEASTQTDVAVRYLSHTGSSLGNDINWSTRTWNFDSVDFVTAWITRIQLWTVGATVVHKKIAEIPEVSLAQYVRNTLALVHANSEPLVYFGVDADPEVTSWVAVWNNPFNFRIRRGDAIKFFLPPADDDATPTGDYIAQFEFHVIDY